MSVLDVQIFELFKKYFSEEESRQVLHYIDVKIEERVQQLSTGEAKKKQPNAATVSALKDAKKGKTKKAYNLEQLFTQLRK